MYGRIQANLSIIFLQPLSQARCVGETLHFIAAELAREKSLGLHPVMVSPESKERLTVMDKGGELVTIDPNRYT
jgi:hypothetical protein